MVIADDRIDARESSLLLIQARTGDAEAFCELAPARLSSEKYVIRQKVDTEGRRGREASPPKGTACPTRLSTARGNCRNIIQWSCACSKSVFN